MGKRGRQRLGVGATLKVWLSVVTKKSLSLPGQAAYDGLLLVVLDQLDDGENAEEQPDQKLRPKSKL